MYYLFKIDYFVFQSTITKVVKNVTKFEVNFHLKSKVLHMPEMQVPKTVIPLARIWWVPMNPSILRKKFLNPSIFWERVKRNLRFRGFQQFLLSIVKAYKYGTHWFKSLTEPLYHVNSQYPPFYCWMCKWKWLKKKQIEEKTMNVSQIIVVTLLEKK